MSLMALVPVLGKVFDRIFPDPSAAQEAKLKLFELQQQGDLAEIDAQVQLAVGQMAVNQEEAKSPHIWVAGWRPFIGWVCGAAMVWNFIIYPTVTWFGIDAPPMDVAQLMIVLGGMLGIGGMRSFDKKNGADTKGVSIG